jgi:thioredoxin 1
MELNDENSENVQKIQSKPIEDNIIIDISDSNFEAEVLRFEKLVIVHFSLESEHDAKITPFLDELLLEYSESIKFCKIKMSDQPIVTARYGVIRAPTLLIFAFGKTVTQIVGAVSKETIKLKIDNVIGKSSEELTELSLIDLKKAYKQNEGDWGSALISGIFAGIIFAIARSNFTGAASLIVPGFALVFFIQNENLRFSWFQKAFAIGIMFIIGMYNKELWELLREFMK